MNIEIINWTPDIKSLPGTCVVIDVLRCSTTIITALELGFPYLNPVTNIEEAKETLRIAEKNGMQLSDGYLDNSPSNLYSIQNKSEGIAIQTTNGIPCLLSVCQSPLVLIAGVVNLSAVCCALKDQDRIFLIASGRCGQPAEEDILLAELIKMKLHNIPFSKDEVTKKLLNSAAAKRLIAASKESDVMLSAQLDQYSVVPFFNQTNNMVEAYDN